MIGTQVWMAENLKVTHYRDGDTIPNVINNSAWEYLNSGGYCDYDNNPVNVAIYGRLYNWYAVSDARNIAPEGWHVPTVTEWQTLIDFLGGEAIAGGEMKEAGTTHWVVSAPDITNESGFTALPAGARLTDGNFVEMGSSTEFWSCTAYDDYAYFRSLTTYGTSILGDYNNKTLGYSIRCVKD